MTEQEERCRAEAKRQGFVLEQGDLGWYLSVKDDGCLFEQASFISLDYVERFLFALPWKDRRQEESIPQELKDVMERQKIQ